MLKRTTIPFFHYLVFITVVLMFMAGCAISLHDAVLNTWDTKHAKLLIEKGADVNAKSKYGTPLYLAATYHNLEIVRLLIEKGADVNARNNDGATPLQAVFKSYKFVVDKTAIEIAKLLIEKGADVNARDNNGETPLHWQISNGNAEVAKLLIEKGADVNAKSKYGKTPLHLAAAYHNLEIARLLIEKDADLNARNNDRETPLHSAFELPQFGEDKTAPKVAKLLIEKGADVNAKSKYGKTPLHLAASGIKMLEMTVRPGTIFSNRSEISGSPREVLIPFNPEIARFLIEKGADVNARDNDGETPLHLAAERGNKEVAQFLIEKGADVKVRNHDGNSPLAFARNRGHREIVELLEKAERMSR